MNKTNHKNVSNSTLVPFSLSGRSTGSDSTDEGLGEQIDGHSIDIDLQDKIDMLWKLLSGDPEVSHQLSGELSNLFLCVLGLGRLDSHFSKPLSS